MSHDSRTKETPAVNVSLQFSQYEDAVVIGVETVDGSKLDVQMIFDAVCDALMYEYGVSRLESRSPSS